MRNIFLVSDTHVGHRNMLVFTRPDGTPLRPFATIEEHDEALIENWNRVVKPEDTVIHLGDVCMSHVHLHKIGQMNGRKVLVQGNHDPVGGKKGKKFPFTDYFEYVTAAKVMDDMILTHVPVHPSQIGRFGTNVHGHLHANEVMQRAPNYPEMSHIPYYEPDPRYLCVSMEHIDYTPIALEDVRARIKARQDAAGYEPQKAWGNGSSPD
jgi:calcineurin-like phosphoesterase family protein